MSRHLCVCLVLLLPALPHAAMAADAPIGRRRRLRRYSTKDD